MPLYDAYGRPAGLTKPVSGSAARRRFVPLPPSLPFQVDEVSELDSIMTELEMGYFRRGALLVDAMGRDDRIEGVLSTRVGALKAAPIDIFPADESRKARKLAERFGGLDDTPGEWDQMFPPSIIGELLRFGIMTGFALAEIIWDTSNGIYRPRLKCWHTQWVRWDQSRYCYILLTGEGEVELPRVDENPHSDGKWILWCPYGYQYAWLRGAVRALGRKYVARQWNEADWSGYNEAHGHPTKLAIHPIEGEAAEHQNYVNAIANSKSQTTIGVPQGTGPDAPKYDMKLVEAQSKTWETFQARIKDLDTDIAILLLGQNLTTEVQGGSLAASATHNLVRMDKANEDACIAACLRDQVLWHEARLNLGDGDLAPRPVYQLKAPEDRTARATALLTTAQAVSAFKLARTPIDERQLLEEANIPALSEEEADAQKAVQAEEAAAQPAQNPGDGGGDQSIPAGDTPSDPASALSARSTTLMIRHESDGYHVYSADGSRHLGGPYKTEEEAQRRLAEVEHYKNQASSVIKRYTFAGLPIAIENPAGTTRLWRDDSSGLQIGATKMLYDYGFIEGHLGSDGEELDVYVGPDENAPNVHVVHQLKPARLSKRLSNGSIGDAKGVGNPRDRRSGIEHAEAFRAIELELNWRTGSGESPALKGYVDRAIGNAKSLGNAANRRAFSAKADSLGEIPEARSAMLAAVIGLLHHDEIRRVVVESVPVDVMDDLVTGKRPAEYAFHHYAVFEALSAAVIDEAVLRCSAQGPNMPVSSLGHANEYASSSRWVTDEDKIYVGFIDADAVKDAFLHHRGEPRAFGGMSVIPIDRFKAKLRRRTGSGKIRAMAPNYEATVAAILRLAERERGGAALKAQTKSKARTRYADRLNSNAVRLAARTLAVDLSAVRDVIDRAESFDEMKAALTKRLKGMDPDRLARVFEKTRLMAKVAGLASADREIRE